MSKHCRTLCHGLSIALLALALPAAAQLPDEANAQGIRTGHVHFTVPDLATHLALWESLGAERKRSGEREYLSLPGMIILLREGEAEAPSIETAANHIGLSVKDYDDFRGRLEAVGASFFFEDAENGQILADLPDGLRVEVLQDREQAPEVMFHHLHLSAADPAALQDWYLRVFGAEAGERRGLPSALVPGGRVDIMPARGEAPRGSQGSVFDHIGFEVDDMEAFAAHLESLGIAFDSPPREVEVWGGLTIAFLTDPAGTYIEVTQGLDEL